MKNVGWVDRSIRLVAGFFVLWLGLFYLDGMNGNQTGIIVALLSGLLFFVAITAFCPVFIPFKISTLTKKETEKFGYPYSRK